MSRGEREGEVEGDEKEKRGNRETVGEGVMKKEKEREGDEERGDRERKRKGGIEKEMKSGERRRDRGRYI